MREYLNNLYKKSNQVSPVRLAGFKRANLIKLLAKYNYNIGAEIGVAEGKFSEYMCKTIPDISLLAIDTWKVGDDARSKQVGQKLANQRYQEAQKRLEPHNCRLVKETSVEASRCVVRESLDFVYIDGCHEFDYVMEDLITWSRRVKHDGIVAGHDFYSFRNAGIVQAVYTYTYMHGIHEWFITDERTPSFFWIKQ